MRKLKISVIVPTFNDADSLQICLDALRDQTLPHSTYEVIIVNNSESPLDLKKEFDGYVFVNQAKPVSVFIQDKAHLFKQVEIPIDGALGDVKLLAQLFDGFAVTAIKRYQDL